MIKSALPDSLESPHAFLDAVYEGLNYTDGTLLNAANLPKSESSEDITWVEKGDWLSLAQTVGAEKIFFVNNDPVIVFCTSQENDDATLLNIFRRVWCMARPHYLFIAVPGELKVYSLNNYPAQTVSEWENIQPLAVVRQIAGVSHVLFQYRRELIESGQVFRDKSAEKAGRRADRRLILDLKAVRLNLLALDKKVKQRHIHAVIGRSIFVRYLEDRGILTPDYFRQVAENRSHPKWKAEWLRILETPESGVIFSNNEDRRYTRVLRNKDFTYALFNQLAEHFNGDMFPRDVNEESEITQGHLDLLRGFLLGNADFRQPKLFLWAYDFEIIPIELISSIYEEFYHKSSIKDKGTHYTPSVLVEYVLSQILTPERLATKPRILDFACGSAIFLVQAFRRIVRYRESLSRKPLSAAELRQILREQITGIEINEEAIHVAAFSLYLALLHYQEPKDILAQIEQTNGEKPLPYLIFDPKYPADSTHYHVLYQANTFGLLNSEKEFIRGYLDQNDRFAGRAEFVELLNSPDTLPFSPHSFDVIVGNPPWGYLKQNEGTRELHAAQEQAQRWCRVFDWSIGDNELSQAFIARTSILLKGDGECGLLVSYGVLLKRHEKSLQFRQRWLSENTIHQVVNFFHVRDAFFSGAISPFSFVQYKPGEADFDHFVQYWSAKKTEFVDNMQTVVLSLPDLHRIRQCDLEENDWLWKTYWWGNHNDAKLVNTLTLNSSLQDLASVQKWPEPRRGYEQARDTAKSYPSNWLKKYRELPVPKFKRYGSVMQHLLDFTPDEVRAHGSQDVYAGWRLLVKQGITQASGADGLIDTRLENEAYCYQSSIYGINVDNALDWQRKVLTAILWSSLIRYYFFMTAGSWGTWRHKIYLYELMNTPIRLPNNLDLREKIVSIVDELRDWDPTPQSTINPDGLSAEEIRNRRNFLENRLDETIFDLYELNESERDLILDMCETGLEFFYRGGSSEAVKPVEPYPNVQQGTLAHLHGNREMERGLEGYLYAFLRTWNRELESLGGEFRWRIIRPSRAPMLAVIFSTQEYNETLPAIEGADEDEWQALLKRLNETLRQPVSSQIYIEGMVRAVTDTDIFIIKRNERRLWTRSLAREDAEATLLQAINMQESVK
ncbi:MAG: N-6 DNA methylase [Chloroflexi bacterium]|nr:N-6 DNA methylase [Chloroflexota bacterium]